MSGSRSTAEIQSALTKHVSRFMDSEKNFSPQTVTEGLKRIHGQQPEFKGLMIATFNATHGSDNLVCPVTHAKFAHDPQTGYAKFLHLGTMRIWNADGSINEERWKQFENFVASEQGDQPEKIVTLSMLKKYLKKCYDTDAPETQTGRNATRLFSSKFVQGLAATTAWDEVFDRLACGWKSVNGSKIEFEPYMTLDLIREFFVDSNLAFEKAEAKELPVAKPSVVSPMLGRTR